VRSSTIISILWPLTCFALTALGIIFKSPGPYYTGGGYYILLSLFILLLSFAGHKKGLLTEFKLPLGVFILGVSAILFSEPLYENDHYRYLWEGNAFLRGENPYLHAPNSGLLDHLIFIGRERIGFDHLTTVYPPLGIIWFGLGGILGLDVGLRVLMVLNAILVYLCFIKISKHTKPWMLVALFPFFAKEFIQAIHIDLLAAFFFLLFMMEKSGNFPKRVIFVFLSIWTKVLGVAALPFLLFLDLKDKKDFLKRIPPLLIVAISLPLFLEWLVGLKNLMGVKEFTIDWVWNPGFYSLLTRIFDFFDDEARSITGVSYGLYLLILTGFCFKEIYQKRGHLSQEFCNRFFYLIFAGLMFFTPVYNGWYAIWFVFPALILKLNFGVLYGVISAFCYIHYGLEDYHWLGELLTHIWFPLSLIELIWWKSSSPHQEHKI
jgi:hypothetical protein